MSLKIQLITQLGLHPAYIGALSAVENEIEKSTLYPKWVEFSWVTQWKSVTWGVEFFSWDIITLSQSTFVAKGKRTDVTTYLHLWEGKIYDPGGSYNDTVMRLKDILLEPCELRHCDANAKVLLKGMRKLCLIYSALWSVWMWLK